MDLETNSIKQTSQLVVAIVVQLARSRRDDASEMALHRNLLTRGSEGRVKNPEATSSQESEDETAVKEVSYFHQVHGSHKRKH